MIERLRAFWNRPISDRERPRLLAASVTLIAVCAAATLLITRANKPTPTPAGRAPSATATPATTPAATATATVTVARLRPEDVTAAHRSARRFLAGYLPYTYGRANAGALEEVSPQLRDELAQQPPRVPARLHRARPQLLSVTSELHGADLETVAQVDDGQRRYSISLLLERGNRGSWRVAAIGG